MPEDGPRTHNLRLFVAIELPDDVRTALQRTIDVLQRASAADGLRWVRPESIHLTPPAPPRPQPPPVPPRAGRRRLLGGPPRPPRVWGRPGGRHASRHLSR